MNILIIEPEQAPREVNIDGKLETLQKLVGGTIEAVYPYDDPVALVCNDEGKLLGLPLNRALRGGDGQPYDVLAGTFLVCGLTEQNFGSLTPELLEKYKQQFAHPEVFMRMGSRIMSFQLPMEKPKGKNHNLSVKPGHDDR